MLQCEVIGNIGSDAEIKEFGGKKYVSFNVAHSEKRKDANGAMVESTTWVSVLRYGDGGGLTQYLKKGCKVFVRGRLSVKPYQDRNGNTQVAVNVNANEVNLCGFKGEQSTAASSATQQPSTLAGQDNDDLPF